MSGRARSRPGSTPPSAVGAGGLAGVGSAARSLLGRLDSAGNMERARAVAAWRDVAGPEVAAHARGFAMREGELLVYVDSPVWATELAALSEWYRTAVNTAIGKDLVGSVRFRVSKRVREMDELDREDEARAAAGHPERVAPVPATEQERAQITAMAAGIHNEALREAAVRAAICGLELAKGRAAHNEAHSAVQRVDTHENGV